VSFATITLCLASQRLYNVAVYFVIDSVRKILDTPSYFTTTAKEKRITNREVIRFLPVTKHFVLTALALHFLAVSARKS
jgi:hypothetical protein